MNLVGQDKKMEIRILQVFSTLGVGGAETWLMALLRYFDRVKDDFPFRIRFDICMTSGNKGVFDDEAAALGARLFYPRYGRKNLFGFIREFRSILADGQYDAIHDHQDYTSGFHFLFGLGHLPAVRIAHIHTTFIHINNYALSQSRKLTVSSGKQLLANLSTHVIGTSRQIVSEYGFDERSFDRVKRGVVNCGFDVARFTGDRELSHREICREFGWNSSTKVLLFAGRLNPIDNPKNPEFALEVAKLCVEKDANICFLMAGNGDNVKPILEARVRKWGLERSIRIIGARADIPKLMLSSSLLLFPSIAEGLGMVAVEAQAAGLRVLASDSVPHECEAISGMLFFKPLIDGATAWAEEVIKKIYLSPTDLASCNIAVRNSSFSIENSAAALLKIYTGQD